MSDEFIYLQEREANALKRSVYKDENGIACISEKAIKAYGYNEKYANALVQENEAWEYLLQNGSR